jgi:hypothetical protein
VQTTEVRHLRIGLLQNVLNTFHSVSLVQPLLECLIRDHWRDVAQRPAQNAHKQKGYGHTWRANKGRANICYISVSVGLYLYTQTKGVSHNNSPRVLKALTLLFLSTVKLSIAVTAYNKYLTSEHCAVLVLFWLVVLTLPQVPVCQLRKQLSENVAIISCFSSLTGACPRVFSTRLYYYARVVSF